MTLLLVLGFAIVAASGVLFHFRGRRAASVVLAVAGIVGLIVTVAVGGREGVGEFALGVLVGLPALIGGSATRNRAEKAARSRPLPAQK